jgi:parvulin-like peptidyl-prolyl isomerase
MKDSVSPAAPSPAERPAHSSKRHKTAPVRRVSARVADRRDPRPIIFNYGANLTRHEREKAKERLAMIAVAAVGVACVLILGWGWLDQNVIIPAQPVATVNGQDIHKDVYGHMQNWQNIQLNAQMSQLQQEMASLSSNKNSASLNQLLQQQYQQLQTQQQNLAQNSLTNMEESVVLRQQAASQYGIKATASDLDKQLATIKKQLGGANSYSSVLKQTGLTEAEFRTWIVEPAVLRPKVTARVGANISTQGPLQVHARHILVKTKATAESVLAQLRAGGSWKTLAKKYSTDPGSKDKGGDLGTFAQGTMVAPFDKAAFSMKPDEIRLVQSQYGWHIIQVLNKPTHQKLSASDLQSKKDNAFTTWLQNQVNAAKISPPSAVPNFGYSGLGSGTSGQ